MVVVVEVVVGISVLTVVASANGTVVLIVVALVDVVVGLALLLNELLATVDLGRVPRETLFETDVLIIVFWLEVDLTVVTEAIPRR